MSPDGAAPKSRSVRILLNSCARGGVAIHSLSLVRPLPRNARLKVGCWRPMTDIATLYRRIVLGYRRCRFRQTFRRTPRLALGGVGYRGTGRDQCRPQVLELRAAASA